MKVWAWPPPPQLTTVAVAAVVVVDWPVASSAVVFAAVTSVSPLEFSADSVGAAACSD